MAFYIKRSEKRFLLGSYIITAMLEYSYSQQQKLVAYNFPFAEGVDYEVNGTGEVTITLKGYFCDWINLNNKATKDINDLKRAILNFGNDKVVRFVHPDLTPEDVQVKTFDLSQAGSKEGYQFTLTLVRVTPIAQKAKQTQSSVEQDFEAKEISNDIEYTVQQGDTLWGIAQKYLGSGKLYSKIWNYKDNATRNVFYSTKYHNGIQKPDLIKPGFKFSIPKTTS